MSNLAKALRIELNHLFDECFVVLSDFESILNSPELSDSQKKPSVETSIAKLEASKALVESKRINPELWMLRRARKDR
jgi:hypothetical protein